MHNLFDPESMGDNPNVTGPPTGRMDESDHRNERPPEEVEATEPLFGLIDVVESFTAMRHEWRTQTRENRELATAIQQATERLLELETNVAGLVAPTPETDDWAKARALAEAIIEIDVHLSRAVEAVVNSQRAESVPDHLTESVRNDFGRRFLLTRWFCRRFFRTVLDLIAVDRQALVSEATMEGLTMVVTRIRRIMNDVEIERLETLGSPFDGATMHAIASIDCEQQPSGHVAEQLSAAYFWREELIRYADVHVAR